MRRGGGGGRAIGAPNLRKRTFFVRVHGREKKKRGKGGGGGRDEEDEEDARYEILPPIEVKIDPQ